MTRYPRQYGWLSCIARINLLLLCCHAALAAKPNATLPSPRPSAVDLVRIDELARKAISVGHIPGISIAIERHGVTIYRKGFGYADLENNVPVTAETVFPVGSITKTMTGLAIQQLIHQGKVDLDATAGRYLPNLPAPARDAKIRALLDHTSGIVGYTDIPDFPNNAQKRVSRDEIVGWFASRPLLFTPGSRWSYTNSGQYILGLVIEAVSGESYSDYLQHYIFAPFGMKSATLEGWEPLIAHRAHGYRRGANGFENAPRYDPLLPFAAGAVMSSASDLLKYRRGVFGAATPPAIRDQILKQDRLDDGFLLPYSLGCLVIGDFEGHRRLGHPGDIYGYSAQYSYYPDDDITIAILTNTQDATFPPMSLEQKIMRVLLGIPAPTLVDAAVSDSIARTLVGEYAVSDMRFGFDRIAFDVRDGHLWMALGGKGAPAVALRYQGRLNFISSVDDEQHIDFAPADAATVTVSFYGSPLSMHRTAPPQP